MTMTFDSLAYDNKKNKIHRGEVASRNGQSNTLESFNTNNREILPQSWQWLSAHTPGKDATDTLREANGTSLSDPTLRNALYDIKSLRWFASVDSATNVVPAGTTTLDFRHFL